MRNHLFNRSRPESLAIPSQRNLSDPTTGRRKHWWHIFSAKGKSRPVIVERDQAVQS